MRKKRIEKQPQSTPLESSSSSQTQGVSRNSSPTSALPIALPLKKKERLCAKKLARAIASGKGFVEATRIAGVDGKMARKWMAQEWWRPLVRKYFMKKEDVEDALDAMMPLALEAYRDGVVAGDLKERRDTAKEILASRGYSRIERKQVEHYLFVPEFVASTKGAVQEMGIGGKP